jgi:CO/xanthine dehydrogenase Mo-binding subunit
MGPDASRLLAAWHLDPPLIRPAPAPASGTHSGAHRNADPLYAVGQRRVVSHLVDGSIPRTSSLRALGAYANVFAIESFMDELAIACSAGPMEFRLRHLTDPRARAVIETTIEMAGGLEAPGGIDAPGRGLAFARYKNSKTYVAVVAELRVIARTGAIELTHAWIAADAGEVIDPDGLVNQLEGGFVQAASWTLKERVGFDADGVSTRDWESYPILTFSEVPEIATRLLDHPGEPSLGAGEAIAGPAAAAIANAVFQATGARIRDLPLTPYRVKAALAELV